MTVKSDDGAFLSDQSRLEYPHLEPLSQEVDLDEPQELRLEPGERYGWWEDHRAEETKKVAVVHGAVNNCRTKILLDSGASVSMVSLDLARRLKLILSYCKQLRVSGLGGVPTVITASVEVKITLGPRVVYVMELWAANIGEGIDVLLGMNLMYSAGVRRCAREGLVQLPDDETVLISGRSGNHAHRGLDLPVCPANSVCLQTGGQTVIRIEYGQSNPQREVVWAGRGDHWVTQIIYAAKSWPVAVKVVNISDKTVWIDPWTPVARIVEFGCFPSAGRFVRPGLTRYQEWQTLIYEHTNSNQARLRQEWKDQMLRDAALPCVPKKDYPWPTKLLTKSSSGDGTAHVIQLRPLYPDVLVPPRETNPEAVIPGVSSLEDVGQDVDEGDDNSLDGSRSGISDSATNEDVRPDADCQMSCLDVEELEELKLLRLEI
jgi:hypothetical protein